MWWEYAISFLILTGEKDFEYIIKVANTDLFDEILRYIQKSIDETKEFITNNLKIEPNEIEILCGLIFDYFKTELRPYILTKLVGIIELIIEDQIPVSQSGEITVDIEETSGAMYDNTTGKLTWKAVVQPGEIMKKQLRFTVSYPKKVVVAGL